MKRTILLLFTLSFIGNIIAQKDAPIYSFFSAGHAYGNPNSYHLGLHYPFVDYFPTLNNYPNMEMGFFTGDIVYHSNAEYWDAAELDMSTLNMPIHLAAGNHDVSEEFSNRFGDYYYSFVQHNDLFIVLTPSLDHWNISGDQLAFLINTLDENYLAVNNIFILLHELIWWSPTNEYQEVQINYTPHYPGSSNFESEIKPLLLSYPNPITLYAGDLGATSVVSFVMYHHFDNITLIGSGMGNGANDNIIITQVYQDSVYYDLVSIHGDDPNALGELTDYSIISSTQDITQQDVQIYPNPASDFVYIHTSAKYSLEHHATVSIINSMGVIIDEFRLKDQNLIKDIKHYPAGLYFFIIKDKAGVLETHKILIK